MAPDRLPHRRRWCDHRLVQSANTKPLRRRLGTLSAVVLLISVLAACGDSGSGAPDTTITRTQIEANGFVFEARTAGPKRGSPVLLLHGFPESSLEWEAEMVA